MSEADSRTETAPLRGKGTDPWLGKYGGNDPYATPLASLVDVKKASDDLRRGFVRKVYGILAMQLLLTALIAVPFQIMDDDWLASNAWLMWVSGPSAFIIMCALACNPLLARSYPANEICLFLLTAFIGVQVGYVSATYTWQSVILAVGITLVVTVGLTIFAFFTSTDLTGMGTYIFGALLTMIAFSLVLLTMGLCGVRIEWLAVLIDFLCVLVFVTFIIYDTQLILGSWGGHEHEYSLDDYVFAALSLYLDVINLLLSVLSLTGNRSD